VFSLAFAGAGTCLCRRVNGVRFKSSLEFKVESDSAIYDME